MVTSFPLCHLIDCGQVEDFKPHIPLISALRNPGMRERHWKELSSQIGIDIVLNDSFTLTKVFSLGLGSHIEVRRPASARVRGCGAAKAGCALMQMGRWVV